MYYVLRGNVDQYEEYLGLQITSRLVKPISHYVEDLSEDLHVVLLVKNVGDLSVFVDIRQHFLQLLQAEVGICAQLMSEGPNNAIQYSAEMVLLQREQQSKVEFD